MRNAISLIFTCYNEEEIIAATIQSARNYLHAHFPGSEVIVVDDGSSDGSAGMVEKLSSSDLRLLRHEKNLGRGAAVATGIRAATREFVGYLDTDLEIPLSAIEALTASLENGADLASGRRTYSISALRIHRWALSRGYNAIMRAATGADLNDTETGAKFFRRDAILPVLERCESQGWFWDTEIMVLALRAGLVIREIPTPYVHNPAVESKVKILDAVAGYLLELARFRRRIGSWEKR